LQRILIFFYTNLEWIWAIIIYKRLKNKVLICKYEDLINGPDLQMSKVFEFCGLEYNKKYIEEVGVIGSSHVEDTSSGVSSHGVQKWKSMLNGFEKLWFKILIYIFKY
jgi:hypothetical protein